MIKKAIWISVCSLCCLACGAGIARTMPEAKVTVRVVDEAGQSVTNASVGIGFYQGGNAWIGKDESKMIRGLSDSNGLFSAQSKSLNDVGFNVIKDGYYRSYAKRYFYSSEVKHGRWQPWNPTNTVVIKEIKNPIPMYVKQIDSKIPKSDVPIGYDLEQGDWVAPCGRGMHADLFFHIEGWFESFRDHNLTLIISFPNEGDGIQSFDAEKRNGSLLRSSQNAPQSGYKSQWIWKRQRERDPQNPVQDDRVYVDTYDENRNYYFRVRTVLDDEGNIIKACYGKIYGDIRFGGSENGYFWMKDFTYYFNPDSDPKDRNVECASEQNLFGGTRPCAP